MHIPQTSAKSNEHIPQSLINLIIGLCNIVWCAAYKNTIYRQISSLFLYRNIL